MHLPDIAYSVIIPVFNEAESLSHLQERLHRVMESQSHKYEIIYVDDASQDRSAEVLKGLESCYRRIRFITHGERKGKSASLTTGFKAAKGKWVVTLDADLQNPPEEITKLLQFKDEFDFITGVRKNRKDSLAKRIPSSLARLSRRIVLGDFTRDAGCGLQLFHREKLGFFPYFRNFFLFHIFLAKVKGFSVKEVEIEHERRKFGRSKYGTFERMLKGITDLRTAFKIKKELKS